ncbi:hypothetical protein [Caballeronia sp. BCC1704]|nr:hypothetical protein [Caballeronia sp. BCC1704]
MTGASSQCATSVIDGEVVAKEGRLTTVDLRGVVERQNALAGALANAAH